MDRNQGSHIKERSHSRGQVFSNINQKREKRLSFLIRDHPHPLGDFQKSCLKSNLQSNGRLKVIDSATWKDKELYKTAANK